MRSQANTAKLLEQSATLMRLRELEALERVVAALASIKRVLSATIPTAGGAMNRSATTETSSEAATPTSLLLAVRPSAPSAATAAVSDQEALQALLSSASARQQEKRQEQEIHSTYVSIVSINC